MEIFFLFGTKESSTERKKKKSKVIIMNQRSLQNASPERHKEKKTPSLPFRAQWCQRWRLMVGTQVSHWSNMPSFQKLLKRETCQPWCSAAVRGWRFARNPHPINNPVIPHTLLFLTLVHYWYPLLLEANSLRVIDICSALFSIPVDEASQYLLAFTREEQSTWTVTLQGFTESPYFSQSLEANPSGWYKVP